MIDPGASNTFVGHRRWILYPPTQTMGVGDIPADSNALYVIQPPTPVPAVTAVAWSPAGYVPAPLIPQRWSLQSSPDSDFSRATVAVSENGVPQTVEILSNDDNGYGGNAIVWDLPFAPAPQPGLQTVYSVDVENVLIDGAPQSLTYATGVIHDPSRREVRYLTSGRISIFRKRISAPSDWMMIFPFARLDFVAAFTT